METNEKNETTATPKRIEAYGVKGLQSKPWSRTFASEDALGAWLDENEGDIEVLGTREAEGSNNAR